MEMKSAHFLGDGICFDNHPLQRPKKWTSRQIRSLCSGWRERFPPRTIATSSSTTFSSGFLYLGGENWEMITTEMTITGIICLDVPFYHVKQASRFYHLNLWLLRPEYLFCLISKNKRIPSAHNLSNPSSNSNIPLHIMRTVCKKGLWMLPNW